MSADPTQIREIIQNARQALRRGEHDQARRWARHAAELAPEMEDPWLLLAAVSDPHESLEYAQRALAVNPSSTRAHTAVEWANKRLGIEPRITETPEPGMEAGALKAEETAPIPVPEAGRVVKPRRQLVPVLLLTGLACAVVAFAAWSVSKSSALASIVRNVNEPAATSTLKAHFAQADISKPTYTPVWTSTPTLTPTPTFTVTPSITPTPKFTSTPEPTPTPHPQIHLHTRTHLHPPADRYTRCDGSRHRSRHTYVGRAAHQRRADQGGERSTEQPR